MGISKQQPVPLIRTLQPRNIHVLPGDARRLGNCRNIDAFVQAHEAHGAHEAHEHEPPHEPEDAQQDLKEALRGEEALRNDCDEWHVGFMTSGSNLCPHEFEHRVQTLRLLPS